MSTDTINLSPITGYTVSLASTPFSKKGWARVTAFVVPDDDNRESLIVEPFTATHRKIWLHRETGRYYAYRGTPDAGHTLPTFLSKVAVEKAAIRLYHNIQLERAEREAKRAAKAKRS